MTGQDVLTLLGSLGIAVTANGDRLHLEAPRGVLTPELRATIAEHKRVLLAALAEPSVRPWVGQVVTWAEWEAFKTRHGLVAVGGGWPEGEPRPLLCMVEAVTQ